MQDITLLFHWTNSKQVNMENLSNLKSVFNQRTTDYSFVIIFLLVFSVFIIFAISPSLKTAFSLKKEERDLTNVDNVYEKKIMNIADIQYQIETNRDDIPLLNQAMSQYPEVNKMIDDVKTIADKNSLIISKANISDVNLRQETKQIDKVRLNIEAKAGYDNLQSFIKDLFSQRRLKMIDSLTIRQDKESTESGTLTVVLVIDGFYL